MHYSDIECSVPVMSSLHVYCLCFMFTAHIILCQQSVCLHIMHKGHMGNKYATRTYCNHESYIIR